ncbi:hypothetical protein [Bdellovibrio svalbardensis]|uniref:Restriction endonuclease type IV Mrr domain-containing protein n=1 Tax=Bdellovibrio svalbardensis TaxID=2972972 RepID=A0ABT6DFV9_9BACT|nr:hypothetical protein [Bdellovibrio svalbardensis]MDG0815135.1 hypothetical protein [Bdellovibrio svalbardensis]
MARISSIKAALLEEAILYLLEDSCYTTVQSVPNINRRDPYLENAPNGICVLGRGEKHQIDAIADYVFPPPFSNPLRLLCEAKYSEGNPVGISIIRNAVGVKKDVEEYFRPSSNRRTSRYHYQYAVISSSGFTVNAQNYAYAQDIYLLDLSADIYESIIIDVIDLYVETVIVQPLKDKGHRIKWNTDINIDLKYLRETFRGTL